MPWPTEVVFCQYNIMNILSEKRIMNFEVSRVWPILSDTANLNRKIGLAPMNFTTISGVRHGQQKIFGINLRWTEAPWEWKHESWLKNKRIYSTGFFHSIEGYFEIKPLSNSQSQVLVQFTIHHKYTLLAKLLNKSTQSIIKKLLDEVEKGAETYQISHEIPTIASFSDWLAQAQLIERARIAPKFVARMIGSSWQDILHEALSPAMRNRLSLRFDAICPHCQGAKKSVTRLIDLSERLECESCKINFTVGSQESIEVSLRDNMLSPEQASVDFCSADVTHKPTILFQRMGGEWRENLKFKPGNYAIKKKGEERVINLIVDGTLDRLLIDVDLLWNDPNLERLYSHPEVELLSRHMPLMDHIMIEQLDFNRGPLIVSDLILYNEFQKMIPSESLVTDFPIEMGSKALLFTDVVGSTELYYKLGDTKAFQQVRESFLLIGEVTKRNEGVLVKTIGDATMFAFSSGEAALRTAIEIQEANKDRALKLRVSLHYGPCLSVGTQEGQDFFGDTVNICAKIQSEAQAGQVVFEESLCQEISPRFWQSLEPQLEKVPLKLKGESSRSFLLYRLSLN